MNPLHTYSLKATHKKNQQRYSGKQQTFSLVFLIKWKGVWERNSASNSQSQQIWFLFLSVFMLVLLLLQFIVCHLSRELCIMLTRWDFAHTHTHTITSGGHCYSACNYLHIHCQWVFARSIKRTIEISMETSELRFERGENVQQQASG